MKQTFTKESIHLKQGNIYLFDDGLLKATTDESYKDIIPCFIDRKEFVKPVDVEVLAKEYATKQGDNARNYAVAHDWISGYNANPNEFTREQVIKICTKILKEKFKIHEAIESVYVLEIPESVTIENNQVISVVW